VTFQKTRFLSTAVDAVRDLVSATTRTSRRDSTQKAHMPLIDRKSVLSFMAGAATGALATKFGPNFLDSAKPALKTAVKVALLGAEAGREFIAHAKEALEDATAEAQAELKDHSNGVSAVTSTTDFATVAATAPKGVGSA